MRVVLFAMLLCTGVALAIDQAPPLEDAQLQARYEKLTNELRCLVCQNQSIADSTADLAEDLREQVRAMLLDGASDEDVLSYMVDRYGDFVRYRPAFNQKTWLLWIGPFVVMLLGVLVGLTIILRRSQTASADT